MITKLMTPILSGLASLLLALGMLAGLAPVEQQTGVQGTLFEGASITTTVQTAVVACGQGEGDIGRKTLVVHNETGGNAVTVTAELRDFDTAENFTSGYLAVNGLAAGSSSSATVDNTAAAGRFCQVSAVSANTSTITVTLRRE